MKWAQFYTRNLSGKVTEAIGDRAVIILDGRETIKTHRSIAHTECIKRGYLGFKIMMGESFTRSVGITPYYEVEQ